MSRHTEIVCAGGVSIETYVDGDGPAVVVIPSYGRGGGEDFDSFTAALAAAAGRSLPPEIDSAPMRAADLTRPDAERLAALRLAFFAPGHDASIWLRGWYPETLEMQVASIAADQANLLRYWAAGTAPIFEIIAALDPFHQPEQWSDLKAQFGSRVTSVVTQDASHALFPEQSAAVASAVIGYLEALKLQPRQVRGR